MIREITYCKGDNCPLKDNCYRYIAYKELEGKEAIISIFMNIPYKNNECIWYEQIK
jgi:hypothetical protein